MSNPPEQPTPISLHFPSADDRTKREALIDLLDMGKVSVFIVSWFDGVDIPAHLKDQTIVHLHLSRRFESPPEIGLKEIRATLSFGSDLYPCVLPWGAVVALKSAVATNCTHKFKIPALPMPVRTMPAGEPVAHDISAGLVRAAQARPDAERWEGVGRGSSKREGADDASL